MVYLCNSILALNDGKNSFLLNWRRLDETMTVDSSQYSFFKSHIVETFDYFIPVSFKFFFIYYTALLDIIAQKREECLPCSVVVS